jgi:hypothetical protein
MNRIQVQYIQYLQMVRRLTAGGRKKEGEKVSIEGIEPVFRVRELYSTHRHASVICMLHDL